MHTSFTSCSSLIPMNYFSNKSDVEVSIEYSEPHCPWSDLDWTTSSIIMLTVCILFIALVIIGTLVDALLWLTRNFFQKSGAEFPTAVADSTPSDVEDSINEDCQQLTNAKPESKVILAKTRLIEFLKNLILSFSLYTRPSLSF